MSPQDLTALCAALTLTFNPDYHDADEAQARAIERAAIKRAKRLLALAHGLAVGDL